MKDWATLDDVNNNVAEHGTDILVQRFKFQSLYIQWRFCMCMNPIEFSVIKCYRDHQPDVVQIFGIC